MKEFEICEYLNNNKDFLLLMLKDNLKERENLIIKEPFFEDEINKQFINLARYKTADYISRLFACDYETVIILLEGMEYFDEYETGRNKSNLLKDT